MVPVTPARFFLILVRSRLYPILMRFATSRPGADRPAPLDHTYLYGLRESQTVTALPGFILRDVFGHEPTRNLLLHLKEFERSVAYTEVREGLDEHPEAFHRSVQKLEHHGLLGRRAVSPADRVEAGRSYRIFLELTGLGRFYAELWHEFEKKAETLAKAHHLSSQTGVEA